MYFRQILHSEKACVSYLVGCPTRGVCAAVDSQGAPEIYVSQVQLRVLHPLPEPHWITSRVQVVAHADKVPSLS